MSDPPLIDANVLLRHILADHETHSPAARQLFRQVAAGAVYVRTTQTIVAEVVWVLGGGLQQFPRQDIVRAVEPLVQLPGIVIDDKPTLIRAFDFYAKFNIDFIDALSAAAAEGSDPPELYSFDRDFDRITSIRRIEPPSPAP